MSYCTNCGKQAAAASRFCGHCGQPLEQTPPEPAAEAVEDDFVDEPEEERWIETVPDVTRFSDTELVATARALLCPEGGLLAIVARAFDTEGDSRVFWKLLNVADPINQVTVTDWIEHEWNPVEFIYFESPDQDETERSMVTIQKRPLERALRKIWAHNEQLGRVLDMPAAEARVQRDIRSLLDREPEDMMRELDQRYTGMGAAPAAPKESQPTTEGKPAAPSQPPTPVRPQDTELRERIEKLGGILQGKAPMVQQSAAQARQQFSMLGQLPEGAQVRSYVPGTPPTYQEAVAAAAELSRLGTPEATLALIDSMDARNPELAGEIAKVLVSVAPASIKSEVVESRRILNRYGGASGTLIAEHRAKLRKLFGLS